MPAADSPVPNFRTDEPLWYNNGVWGTLGYAVPNWGDNPRTLNGGIFSLANVIGRNLSAIMQQDDTDMRTPPTINTLTMVHKLILRARTIIASRAVPPGTPEMKGVHDQPAARDFLVYPCPYFMVRNEWLARWASLVMSALTEAMQHSENRRSFAFSTDFGGLVGQYLNAVYVQMAIELFGVAQATAQAPGYTLDAPTLASYNPAQWFTQTELIDTSVPTYDVPTALDLRVLTNGIAASKVVGLARWPSGDPPTTAVSDDSAANAGEAGPTFSAGAGASGAAAASSASGAAAAPATVAFPPPPGP